MSNRMDDLELLRELGSTLDPDPVEPPAALRWRVLAAERPRRRMAGVLGPRTGMWLATVGTAAAVVALSVGVAVLPRSGTHGTGTQRPAATTSTVAGVDPATFLRQAAAAARRAPDPKPRADQLFYIESREVYNGPGPVQRHAWMSIDGRHDGRVDTRVGSHGAWERLPIGGCHPGIPSPNSGPTAGCPPLPAYRTDLPTEPEALLGVLTTMAGVDKDSIEKDGMPADVRATRIFEEMAELLFAEVLPPNLRAALFETMALIPGVRVEPGAVDLLGRPAVAVAAPPSTSEPAEQLMFEAKTFTYLGERKIVSGRPNGQGNAIIRTAIVDRVGQLR